MTARMRTLRLLLSIAALSSACATNKATHLPLPKERATECRTHCDALEMKLAAVVVIANSVGCVCEPAGSEATSAAVTGAAAVSGWSAIAASESSSRPAPRR